MHMQPEERARLRELAKRQREIAELPIMEERKKLWISLNAGNLTAPLVTCEFSGPTEEIYRLSESDSQLVRDIENQMIMNITNHTLLTDDRVIPPCVTIPVQNGFQPFGIVMQRVELHRDDGKPTMAYQYEHVIGDLDRDFHFLGKSTYSVDHGLKQTLKLKDIIDEAIGDILTVEPVFPSFAYDFSSPICSLMGMENMLFALYDYPELFHKAMSMLCDDYLAYMRDVEAGDALLPTNGLGYLNQGSWCYSDELPGSRVKFHDIWGFTASQETSSVSVEMFDEFFFTYMERVASELALLSYGCCEPTDRIWDRCLSRLKNLRKLSVSPWCNEDAIAERIRGKRIIYHRKPFPNFISVGDSFDEEAFSQHIVKTVKAAYGCPLEITFRDVNSVCGDPTRLTRAIRIAKEQCMRHWRP